MKTFIYYAALLGMMLIIYPMPGCGKGEDEPKKVVSEAAAPQTVAEPTPPKTVVEQKAGLSGQDNAILSQKTELAVVMETQPAVQEIVDVIIIENKGYTTDKKGPVKFSHLKHNKEYKVSCDECHHLYKDGKNLWKEGDRVDKCIVCHDLVEDKDKTVKLQSAFHKNCRDCHTEASKEGKESPDKKCSECHGN